MKQNSKCKFNDRWRKIVLLQDDNEKNHQKYLSDFVLTCFNETEIEIVSFSTMRPLRMISKMHF
jgi:hypothetical protein